MDNNTSPKFDICDSLDELDELRRTQGALETAIGMDEKIQKIQKLEFEAAAVSSEIVQHFVEMRKRIARLEEDLKDAKDELSMVRARTVRDCNREAEMARAFSHSY